MKKTPSGQLLYSPSDLVRYLASPFASWMDRYYLEDRGAVTPDEETEDEKLIAQTGDEVQWELLDRGELHLVRLNSPPATAKSRARKP